MGLGLVVTSCEIVLLPRSAIVGTGPQLAAEGLGLIRQAFDSIGANLPGVPLRGVAQLGLGPPLDGRLTPL